jgi:F0F1-type ATP synthase membrane subunit c/vacuolar-type H+-ATPase subunit K
MMRTRRWLCALALFGAAIGNGNGAEKSVAAAVETPVVAGSQRTTLGISVLLTMALVVVILRRQMTRD